MHRNHSNQWGLLAARDASAAAICGPQAPASAAGVILEGKDRLSAPTAHESEYLSAESDGADERLGCQTKITEPGDIVVMTTETKEEKTEAQAEEAAKEYAKEFAELPLEKKIAQLVQLEAIALGETVSFVINSPFLIFEKAMDVMAQFGMRKEEEGKKATRPVEHTAAADGEEPDKPAEEPASEN